MPIESARSHIWIEGIVQGVGFRPFVATLADRFNISGVVGNDTAGVFIEAESEPANLKAFINTLVDEAPPLARIDAMRTTDHPPTGTVGFHIVPSVLDSRHSALVAADGATCEDCLSDIRTPGNRRFGYAFTNCTNCGPRFSIVRDVPYDRERTTMAEFTMCNECRAEYDDPANRRFHAEPVCCPKCGPRLAVLDPDGTAIDGDPIAVAADLIATGRIVAVKGLGGYHLAVGATNEPAVARLRVRKHREERPFALMVADLRMARTICVVDETEAALLESVARPIVLLVRHDPSSIAASVAPGTTHLGVMLAYTPLHHLLLAAAGGPIVLTSGNYSDEPIAFDDGDALKRLAPLADAFLTHDRPIQTRVDDSVARSIDGAPLMIRRSRGYTPMPIHVPWRFGSHILGCGAELKNTFCLGREHHVFVSPHIGDLSNFETYESYTRGIEHLQHLFDITPEVVAHDLHPDYLSTRYAAELTDVELVGVQHHHAHIASCLADNAVDGPVIGVAFDGTGYGPDGTIWGGEFLVADLATATRVARLAPVPLPGGAAAIREPWRMLASYLDVAFEGAPPPVPAMTRHAEWDAVRQAARRGVNTPLTSSAGRLFDAIAVLLDLRDAVTYEGQAAIELEQLAEATGEPAYGVATSDDGALLTIHGADLVRAALQDRAAGVAAGRIAARFHESVATLIGDTCLAIGRRHGLTTVALSGGVFQNVRLVRRCRDVLASAGFEVLTHRQVPPNDGGISLGQAVVAAARVAQTIAS